MKRIRQFALLTAVLVVSAAGALAQSTATVAGTVTDPSGAVVAGAQVTLHSLGTGIDRGTVTDDSGVYAVPSLQPGDYQLRVTASGFSLYTVQKLTLEVDQRVTVNPKLAVSSAGETIEVASGAVQIETQSMATRARAGPDPDGGSGFR